MDKVIELAKLVWVRTLDYGLSAAVPASVALTPWVDADWMLMGAAGLLGRLVGLYKVTKRD